MPRYVALLRGINVGGHRVKMDRLREIFVEMGYDDVSTFIASGNVIFSAPTKDADALAEGIERDLAEALGYDVPTFLRTPAELARVVAHEPPGHDEGRALYVFFLKRPPDGALKRRLAEVTSAADRFTVHGREIYWSIDGRMSDSPLFATGLDRALGESLMTSRNVTSLGKLVAKLGG